MNNMSDYISRSELIKRIDKWFCKPCEDSGKNHHNVMCGSCDIDAVLSWLDAIPAADVVAVKRGYWIKTGQSFVYPEMFINYTCSVCGFDIAKTKFNYCPNCGTKMNGGRGR